MVMASILYRWQKRLRWTLALAHVHHGKAASNKQKKFRLAARDLVAEFASELGLDFYSNPADSMERKSEASLRDYRRSWLRQWREEGRFDHVSLAHQRDDLLETRLLRMIRGTGSQGLKAMSVCGEGWLRPLLSLSRAQIEDYARERQLTWVEDPSNKKIESMRNWVRREWLPALEERQPGACQALARSMELMVRPEFFQEMGSYVGLRREEMNKASYPVKSEVVARYLRTLGVQGYGRTHVEEVLKRIDTEQKNFEFEMLGMRFRVSSDLLWASRV